MAEERAKALEAALGQIEKQFGKGSVMRMGEMCIRDSATTSPLFQTPAGPRSGDAGWADTGIRHRRGSVSLDGGAAPFLARSGMSADRYSARRILFRRGGSSHGEHTFASMSKPVGAMSHPARRVTSAD